LLLDELANVGRPAFELLALGADAGALLEIGVGPDVDDPVQRADLGVPEGGERRQFGARRQGLAKPLLGLCDRAGLQSVRAEFDDHGVPPGVLWHGDARPVRRRVKSLAHGWSATGPKDILT